MSGTHGNEYHIIPAVTKAVQKLSLNLPDFMYIPEASPSAVALKTRENECGHDINRGFSELVDSEVNSLKEVLSTLSSVIAISFHEDLESQEFYFYDTHCLGSLQLEGFRSRVRALGVPLRTGIDDPDDPALSYMITDGYVDHVCTLSGKGQFIEDWAINEGLFSRFLTFEIPYRHTRVAELLQAGIEFSLSLLE